MELNDLKKDWKDKTKALNVDYLILDMFPKLCRKAQELIFEAYDNPDIVCYSSTWCIPELVNLTPIEQIYFVAFLTYEEAHYDFTKDKRILFIVRPQKEIFYNNKKYRVDFLFEAILHKGSIIKLNKPIIVECDGYDFHSTKQQRNLDIERENDLKMLGFPIIRFTGSQIYNDPYLCVMQTIKFVYDENKEQLKEFEEVYIG